MTANNIQTQVLVDVLGINVRNPFWGANSESFDPTRFKTIKQSDVCVRFPNTCLFIAKPLAHLVLTCHNGSLTRFVASIQSSRIRVWQPQVHGAICCRSHR